MAYHTVNHRGESIDFATLLRYVNEIEGIGRIRYTTSHPLEFTNELARAHGELPSLAKTPSSARSKWIRQDSSAYEATLHA